MFHLIVTNDKDLIKKARECGAGVFKAEKFPEQIAVATTDKVSRDGSAIYNFLRELDFKAKNSGYHYIKFIMEKCEADPSYHERCITKDIYPECARHFNTSNNRVERAIRHELIRSFGRVPNKYVEIFGGTFAKVPTNSEFIGLIAEYFANNR